MAEALSFDSEAINALANPTQRGALTLRARAIAVRAGALLPVARMASRHAVDAFVVATALEFEQAVIASGDPKDLKRLAAGHAQVSVIEL